MLNLPFLLHAPPIPPMLECTSYAYPKYETLSCLRVAPDPSTSTAVLRPEAMDEGPTRDEPWAAVSSAAASDMPAYGGAMTPAPAKLRPRPKRNSSRS